MRPCRAPSRRGRGGHRRTAAGFALTAALVAAPAAAAAGATLPAPRPGQVAGVAVSGDVPPALDVFYRTGTDRLVRTRGTADVDLGGVLTSGPAAVGTTVYARGADAAVWFRETDGAGWTPWASIGGRALGAPSAACVGPAALRHVYVRGTDGALWRAVHGSGRPWASLGGRLASDPAAPAACAPAESVFALDTDGAVWELRDAWRRVGGSSTVAPAALRLSGGTSVLFVRGLDGALWRTSRPAGGTGPWSGWRRLGGVLTGPPAATGLVTGGGSETEVVQALGADGNLWRGTGVAGTTSWTWRQAP